MGKLTNTSVKAGILAKLSMPSTLTRLAKSSILLLLMSSISFFASSESSDLDVAELDCNNSYSNSSLCDFDGYSKVIDLVISDQLGGTVWKDNDADGIRDTSEPGVGGVNVALIDCTTELSVANTTTDINGSYLFENLIPGEYQVVMNLEELPAGCAFTHQGEGANNYALNLPGTNGHVVIGDVAPASTSYTKEAWVNMASTACDNIISSNQNPFWISGGRLRAGNNGTYSVVTDSDNFPLNTWTHVAVTYDAPTTTMTLYKNGVLVASSISAPANTGGDTAIGRHFGGGCAANGIFDEVRIWSVARTASEIIANMNSTLSGSEMNLTAYYPMEDGPNALDLTNATGTEFTGAFVPVNTATSFVDGAPDVTGNSLDSDVDLLGKSSCTTIQGGTFDNAIDAGLLILSSAGDFVWHDLDEDGIQDAGEPGVEGVKAYLYDTNGVVQDSTISDINGSYLFDGVYPNTYYIAFDIPEGFVSTIPFIGANIDLDSDAANSVINDKVSTTPFFTLGSEENRLDIDFGLKSLYSIGNQVWLDANYNGVINIGEEGIAGVELELYSINDMGASTLVDTTLTDMDGFYLFDSLGSGQYLVVIPATELSPVGILDTLQSTTGSFNSGGVYEDAANPIDADGDMNLDDNGVLDGNINFAGAVISDTITLSLGMEPLLEGQSVSDTDNDISGALDENSNLTIDFGFVNKVYDIALTKTTDSYNNNEVGDTIKFTFTVFNQGNVPLTNIVIEDTNPSGFVTVDAENIPIGWSAGMAPVTSIYDYTSTLMPNTSVQIDYFVELGAGSSAEEFTNMAEIASFEDLLGNSIADMSPLVDMDSTPGNGIADEDDQDTAEAFPCGDNCYLTCIGERNVSVDPLTCMAVVKPSSVSEDIDPSCDFYYIVTLFDEHGIQLPSDTVDASHIGQTITYELSEPGCDANANKCWGTILVEDKIAPTLTAQDFTVSCADINEQGVAAMLLPTVGDDCQNTLPPVLVRQDEISVDCTDPNSENVIGTLVRKYLVQDSGGNISDTATQIITLVRVTVGAIDRPKDIVYPFDTLSCSSGFETDDFGNPDPSVTGVPKTKQQNYGEVPATFNYIDISDSANRVLVGDNESATVNLGASFPLYDMTFSALQVSTNGYISSDLSNSAPDFTNDCPLPVDPSSPSVTTGARIYPLHDDLEADISEDPLAGVFYQYMPVSPVLTPTGMLTGVSIFQWKVDHSNATGAADLDFQALLFDNGEVAFQYNRIGSEMGSGATVGIQSFAMADNSMPMFGTTISCNETNSVKSMTAVGLISPSMGGTDLYPFPEDVFCNGFSEYNDEILFEDSCVTKIMRTFTIGEWRCNKTERRFVTQFIDIADVEGPIMAQLPNITETTAPFSCAANVLLPAVTPSDICNPEDIRVDIEFVIENDTEPRIENVTGESLVTMPVGTHTVTYIATDLCGNMTEMSFTVVVQDKSNPQAICDADELYVSTGPSFFSAVALDNGSFDDCGGVSLLIGRSDDPLYPTMAAFSDKLEFDCDDIGNTYEVVLLVTDGGGNTSICTSDLLIKDKIPGMFLASSIPTDVTLDCTEDLEVYYAANLPQVIDNCTATTFTTTFEVIEEFDACGTGVVRRIFTINELNGATASQIITVQNVSNPLVDADINWPDDFTASDVTIDATPGGLSNQDPIYGFPVITNVSSCIKAGELYTDDTITNNGVCLEIERTWKIIDWCDQNSDGTFPELTDTQTITLGTCTSNFMANVSGMIYTEDTEEVESVNVALMAADALYDMTDETGEYAFPDMPVGEEYMVLPYKNDDHENGVSTLDLVLIQRHILGMGDLDSPYKLIAADINYSQSISAADVVILRKVILGVYDEFPSNNSWRFIDGNYEFQDDTNPWIGNLPEDYEITNLSSNMNIDFIGVKIGDVNGSVLANVQSISTETRNANTWVVEMDEKQVRMGDIVTVKVKSADISNIYGWQYTLETDGLNLLNVEAGKADISVQNINSDRGSIHMSYAKANGLELKANEVLYTLTLQAEKSGQLSDMISISDRGLRAESYHEGLDISNVDIRWNESEDEIEIAQKFSVAQNQPNPWYDKTSVGFYIPKADNVKFIVKDISGRTLFSNSAYREAGKHIQEIEDRLLETNGILIYEVHYNDQVISNRMIHIK